MAGKRIGEAGSMTGTLPAEPGSPAVPGLAAVTELSSGDISR